MRFELSLEFLTAFLGVVSILLTRDPIMGDSNEIRWDWDKIVYDAKDFSQKIKKSNPDFLWGTASSGIFKINKKQKLTR
jgi:hypothetical protein